MHQCETMSQLSADALPHSRRSINLCDAARSLLDVTDHPVLLLAAWMSDVAVDSV
jgi:hypothetical protein